MSRRHCDIIGAMNSMNHTLFPTYDAQALTVTQASEWASRKTGRKVTPSNIVYLINYGRIPKVDGDGALMVRVADLERYYRAVAGRREGAYKRRLGDNLNWRLSFEQFKEAETTKHVHRLHPYKGKFIPQLVEYFLDSHTDEFKDTACFAPGDVVLDPFCGSGTTLIQANELGMSAVGVDVSLFNAMISNLKLSRMDLSQLSTATMVVGNCIAADTEGQKSRQFEKELVDELKAFNTAYFPSPQFRYRARNGDVDEERYGADKANEFMPIYYGLLQKHGVSNRIASNDGSFMGAWFLSPVHHEIDSAKRFIDGYSDAELRDALRLTLSRTMRSARATTHSDLATLVKPITEIYYCGKHAKICKPLFSMLGWWRRYSKDVVKRMSQFGKLRTDTTQVCLTGDSREIDIFASLADVDKSFAEFVRRRKFRGIFSSPPYVGLIDYHEQHAYAYEVFGLPRNDGLEIGPLSAGRSRKAREDYTEGIAKVLLNCRKYLVDDPDIFLVANDKFNLYPRIAEIAGLAIVKEYRRPVLNRAEGSKGAYAETIFHMRMRENV